MHHKDQESSSRKLVWVENLKIAGWGCSECAWLFQPPQVPIGRSLDEWTAYLQRQLEEEFAAHDCAVQPRSEAAAS
jgi:hypothetical protein